jgi:beta-glucosidase
MSGYNKLNGTYAAENRWLLTDVLRGDWGFDGLVMSDWFGSRTTAPTVNAGLDLEMPGPTRDRGAKLVAAVAAGEVDAATVRARAIAVLRLMARVGSLDDHRSHEERAEDLPEVRALIRRAGAAGTVLLRNDGVLPLAQGQRVAVIGPNAAQARIMGGGSAQLNPHYAVSPLEGLRARGDVVHVQGCTNHRWEPLVRGTFTVEWFEGSDCAGTPVHVGEMDTLEAFWLPPLAGGKVTGLDFSVRITGGFVPETGGVHRVGLTATGPSRVMVDGRTVADARDWRRGRTFFEEGCDEVVGEVTLQAGQRHAVTVEFAARRGANLQVAGLRVGIGRPMGDAEIAAAAAAAAQADVAVVCVGRSGEWDTEGSDLGGIRLPGRQDDLVAAVIAANPRTVVVLQTGGPVELPWMGDAAAILQAWYPGQECGNAIADVLYGDAEPGGRLPQTFPKRWEDNPTWSQDPEVYPGLDGKVRYEEGLFIGYRHYDRQGIAPMFPFGHGLSYTDWALSGLTVGDGVARVTVANTGARAGSTVVQVYVGGPEGRPLRSLAGFAKVALAPGETREVAVGLPDRAFAGWDVAARGWRTEAGEYRVEVGFSVADLPLSAVIRREEWVGAV